MDSNLPDQVKIIDLIYTIEYVENAQEVDIFKRKTLSGQCDFWTRSIRIHSDGIINESEVRQVLWHEILHALTSKLHIGVEDGQLNDQEHVIDLLATGINVVLHDNPGLSLFPQRVAE